MRIQHNVPLSDYGRKDVPPKKGNWGKYQSFPIHKLKVGYSFVASKKYEYGKTISIKNACRAIARKKGLKYKFAVRKWKDQIRVWRIK